MARQARGESINPQEVQIVHAIQRCVRQAHLCGFNHATGKDCGHRREWILRRMAILAGIFGIDCLTFVIMTNHLHVVLRSRPDITSDWSRREVAIRWLELFPKRREPDGTPCEPSRLEIATLLRDRKKIEKIRLRLSDISWYMRCLAEDIARRANKEDELKGRFFDGRFRSQLILDEISLLACALYVDLNPIRAAMAETPEQSRYTGAHERLQDLRERKERGNLETHDWERTRLRCSGWLSPIEIAPTAEAGPQPCDSGRRPSQKGFLPMSLLSYLELLDWTGRQIRSDKRGSIPSHLAPILSRLGLTSSSLLTVVARYGQIFKRAAGRSDHLNEEAARRGQRWMQAPGNPLTQPNAAA